MANGLDMSLSIAFTFPEPLAKLATTFNMALSIFLSISAVFQVVTSLPS